MKNIKSSIKSVGFKVLALVGIGFIAQGGATLATDYQLVCIHNDTDSTVRFDYLGDADNAWTSMSVLPGGVRSIYWTDPTYRHSVKVHFDSDTSRATDWTMYTVYPVSAESTDCDYDGKDYTFKDDFGDYIDLYTGH